MSLVATGLCAGYPGRPGVLRGVSAAFERGRVTALIGPNGAGKSTLLRALLGLLTPEAGSVTLDGTDVNAMRTAPRARAMAYVPQNGEVAFAFSVRDVVALGAYAADTPAGTRVADAMDLVDVADRAEDPFGTLSAGQQQRVSLARALAQLGVRRHAGGLAAAPEARALLADEPVSAQDPGHVLECMASLRGVARAGLAVVMVVHDLSLAINHADEVVALDASGRLACRGEPAAILGSERVEALYGVKFALIGDSPRAVVPIPGGRAGPAGRLIDSGG